MTKIKAFKHKDLDCLSRTNTLEEITNHIEKTSKIPSPCNECYTVVVYPAKDDKNLKNLNQLLSNEFNLLKENSDYEGAYFRSKGEGYTEELIQELGQKLDQYNVEGVTEWRRCCKRIEEEFPYLFLDSKTLMEEEGYRQTLLEQHFLEKK